MLLRLWEGTVGNEGRRKAGLDPPWNGTGCTVSLSRYRNACFGEHSPAVSLFHSIWGKQRVCFFDIMPRYLQLLVYIYNYYLIHLYLEAILRLDLHSHKYHSEKYKAENRSILHRQSTLVLPWVQPWSSMPHSGQPQPRGSLHLPHWSAPTRSLVWILYQQLHQRGGRSSQQ